MGDEERSSHPQQDKILELSAGKCDSGSNSHGIPELMDVDEQLWVVGGPDQALKGGIGSTNTDTMVQIASSVPRIFNNLVYSK